MSIIETLTEGMVHRNMQQEGASLLNKWSQTGLLEGLSNDEQKAGMARLLENQARELLRESNTMAGGDVEGFAAVAFPIVRRVFAGLIANDLVSVQPMSLPSGLIFFMDFTFGEDTADGASNGRLGAEGGRSIYGQGVLASEITGGVLLNNSTMDQQPYGLGSAYSSPTGSVLAAAGTILIDGDAIMASDSNSAAEDAILKEIEWDADVISTYGSQDANTTNGLLLKLSVTKTALETTGYSVNLKSLSQIHLPIADLAGLSDNASGNGALAFTIDNYDATAGILAQQVRRLTKYVESSETFHFFYAISNAALVLFNTASNAVQAGDGFGSLTAANFLTDTVQATSATAIATAISNSQTPDAQDEWIVSQVHASYPAADGIDASSTGGIGSVVGVAAWGLENEANIPEIDIKVDSIAITAVTKKLKAKWTPELGQDLNAYHNLDAEVELTSILSEQIALEIDREILQDLIKGATAGTFYWSRSPGMFVNRLTGAEIGANTATPDFTGTVSEWYETLIETINDVSAQIHRKTLRGGANFVVLSPEVANVLEFTAGFRANVTADADKGDIGAVKVGSLNRKFDVIVDPYFPRNAILVGRKGSSFLESGYVYAPYVPLQTTPTIFGPEDFVPRKGVMTRYGKKMVRPDMYGLVIVRGLTGEPGTP